jgi:hypothetical protein
VEAERYVRKLVLILCTKAGTRIGIASCTKASTGLGETSVEGEGGCISPLAKKKKIQFFFYQSSQVIQH